MKIAILLIALFAAGCSTIAPIAETATQVVVSHYCDTPQIGRKLVRARFNQIVAPDSIAITCEGD